MALYLTSALGLLLVSGVLIVLTAGFFGSVAARLLQHFKTENKHHYLTSLQPSPVHLKEAFAYLNVEFGLMVGEKLDGSSDSRSRRDCFARRG